jgi:hemolysin III
MVQNRAQKYNFPLETGAYTAINLDLIRRVEPKQELKRNFIMALQQPYVHQEDGGPIYFESDFEAFVAEPFNMVSALIFVPIAIYWLVKNERSDQTSNFMRFASVLLLIGGVGGTIYHGFRISTLALFLDWTPILILCISAAAYFLHRIYNSNKVVLFSSAVIVLALLLNLAFTPIKHYNNIAYTLLGIYVLAPTFLILKKNHWKNWQFIFLALVSFGLALFFRVYDRDGILPIGTHFLWHVFGAFATHFMFFFVFRLGRRSQS